VRAQALSRALREAADEPTPRDAEARMRRVLRQSTIEPEYAVVRDAKTLQSPRADHHTTPCRALIAARVGGVRLIDNTHWSPRA
jgi:pantothenate synthetase